MLNIVQAGLGVPHGFLGRAGGVSEGLYSSLNLGLGSADSPAHVHRNRAIALSAIAPGARLVGLHQVHSARVVEADLWADAARPEADALVTSRPGLALCVLTADCAPVLLADAQAGVIAAAHAGWKGALAGILPETVAAMERLGAARDRIRAAIGPCIARASYEVGPEFRANFRAADPTHDQFFVAGQGDRLHFDLEGFCAASLAAAGVGAVAALGIDTCGDPTRYFSYRRATKAGQRDYGRQGSLIALV